MVGGAESAGRLSAANTLAEMLGDFREFRQTHRGR
jgi:hypothetical protein